MAWLASVATPEVYLRHCKWRAVATKLTSEALEFLETQTFGWELVATNGDDAGDAMDGAAVSLQTRAYDLARRQNMVLHYLVPTTWRELKNHSSVDLSIIPRVRQQRRAPYTKMPGLVEPKDANATHLSLGVGDHLLCTTFATMEDHCNDGVYVSTHQRVQLVHSSLISRGRGYSTTGGWRRASAESCTWRVHRRPTLPSSRKPTRIPWATACAADVSSRAAPMASSSATSSRAVPKASSAAARGTTAAAMFVATSTSRDGKESFGGGEERVVRGVPAGQSKNGAASPAASPDALRKHRLEVIARNVQALGLACRRGSGWESRLSPRWVASARQALEAVRGGLDDLTADLAARSTLCALASPPAGGATPKSDTTRATPPKVVLEDPPPHSAVAAGACSVGVAANLSDCHVHICLPEGGSQRICEPWGELWQQMGLETRGICTVFDLRRLARWWMSLRSRRAPIVTSPDDPEIPKLLRGKGRPSRPKRTEATAARDAYNVQLHRCAAQGGGARVVV